MQNEECESPGDLVGPAKPDQTKSNPVKANQAIPHPNEEGGMQIEECKSQIMCNMFGCKCLHAIQTIRCARVPDVRTPSIRGRPFTKSNEGKQKAMNPQ
jgi:hypothetical protein